MYVHSGDDDVQFFPLWIDAGVASFHCLLLERYVGDRKRRVSFVGELASLSERVVCTPARVAGVVALST